MYLPAMEPIARICRDAIDQGMAGDIPSARKQIDRARTMRAWLARSIVSHRTESLDVWIANSGIAPSEVHHYRSQIAQLNDYLEIIRTWLASSVSAFSHEDLLSSPEGLSLYVDTVLPEVWDFSQDIVVLHGDHRRALFEDLKMRGQRNFVVIVAHGEENAEKILLEPKTEEEIDNFDQVKIVSFPAGSSPKTDIFQKLLGQEVPSIVLIGTESDSAAEVDFKRIYKSLGAVLLGKQSVKEWPRVFTEQWLSRIPTLTKHQSAQVLRPMFRGRDVLIASPGPSLYESLDDLRANRERFIVIAPIRSLLVLLNADIVPDFAFQVDATDFSKLIPTHPMINRVALICTDYAHISVFEGGFGSIYTVPDPAMVGNAITEAWHGRDVAVLEGSCVSTCAVGFAAQFKARSITLVGQDLSLSRGRYVEQTAGASPDAQQKLEEENLDDFLTCEGINGERLKTRHDYHWFIGEMENAARFYSPGVEFINSTAHGALLRGWLHKTLDKHPLIAQAPVKGEEAVPDIPETSADERETRRVAILQAVQLEQDDAEHAANLCSELVAELRILIESGSNDVTKVESLEALLRPLLTKKGSILYFYVSRFSMALAAASKSVQSLEDNLNISAEYYHQVEHRAKKLAKMLEDAFNDLESLKKSGKAASGR